MTNLILTSSVRHLAPQLTELGGFVLLVSEQNKDGKRLFPDGEVYVKLPEFPKVGRFVVVHSGAPDPNGGLAELEMTLSVLRRTAIQDVEVFFTYMPYGMQDKTDDEGETNAAEDLLRKLFAHYAVKKVYAIDPHFGDAPWLSGLPFISVSAHELLLSEARRKYPDAVFVAPDKGHEKRTGGLKGFEKTRTDSYNVKIADDAAFMQTLTGKTVGVVDDIIETGGTMVKFHEACMKYGPKELFAVATHGILRSGIARITEIYGTLFLSNTIDQPQANLDISPLISDTLL